LKRRRWGRALAALALALAGSAQASSLAQRFCDADGSHLSAAEQDRLLRFAAVVRQHLAQAPEPVALISRSGLRLQRWGVRYSHAGLALAAHPEAPWTVRQLYYACDEARPRVFDQGVAGFLFGTESPKLGFASLVFVPGDEGRQLQATALDKETALRVLHPQYSANAHPFSLRYQNCNQWVAELMATTWGPAAQTEPRAVAQAWLQAQGYSPEPVDAGSRAWLWVARAFVPWMHFDDHPDEDWRRAQVRTTLPAALESWLLTRHPSARRVELCHTTTQVVVRENGAPLNEACVAEPGDRVLPL
jgi:hypothetical protein